MHYGNTTHFLPTTLMGLAVLLVAGSISAPPALALEEVRSDGTCVYGDVYQITWDGWNGTLVLRPPSYANQSYLVSGAKKFNVRYHIPADPQDYVEGLQGPGYIGTSSGLKHRIVFWVDFNNTPNNPYDDQRFDGYLMTQTKTALAGVTWWSGIVFGFYATNKTCLVG